MSHARLLRARSLSLQQLQDQEVVPNEGECMIGKVRRSDRRAGALAYVRDTRPPLVLGIPQVFDATEEDCPQNIRIFINAVGLLMSNVLGASQSVK